MAVRALRHRDVSRRRLEQRLAERGAAAEARAEVLAALERAGLLDDARVASRRAEALAGRGYGDAGIRVALELEGFPAEEAAAALAGLEPEAVRAAALAARRGQGQRTLRWLAARGFDPATLENLAGFAGEA